MNTSVLPIRRLAAVSSMILGLTGLVSLPAVAHHASAASEYHYKTIDYPGAPDGSVCIGINSRDDIACTAFGFNEDLPYLYHADTGQISLIQTQQPSGWNADAFGINAAGTVTGYVYPPDDSVENGFVITAAGDYHDFAVPWAVDTESRAINSRGVIVGTGFFSGGSAGFIYDPKSGHYTEVLPSAYTEAAGTTSDGHVVGTVYLGAGAAGRGAPAGQYGYLRAPNGRVALFRVNGQDTYARGISDTGVIVGYFGNLPFPQLNGFATRVDRLQIGNSPAEGFSAISIRAQYELQIPAAFGTLPQAVAADGTISGTFVDSSGTPHGFIARSETNRHSSPSTIPNPF